MTERSRSARYQRLTDLIDDEDAVGEMLSTSRPETSRSRRPRRSSPHRSPCFAPTSSSSAAMQRTFIRLALGAMVSLMALALAMASSDRLVSVGPRLAVAVAVSAAGGQASRGAAVGYVAAHDRQR